MRKNLAAVFGLLTLCVLFVIGSNIQAQEAKAFVGDWNGSVLIGGMEIDIVCHFQADNDGNLTGTIDSPSQGAFDIAISDLQIEGNKISFGVDDPNVEGDPRFNGTLDEAGTTISGDFSQSGGTGTFTLEKE